MRTLILLAWLAAGAQGYGFSSLSGLILAVISWRWARRSLRNHGWAYRTTMRGPSWVRRLLLGEQH